jgi:hypothetical protein
MPLTFASRRAEPSVDVKAIETGLVEATEMM